ncbi:MAG: methyltransferase domain-containing protein [Pseudomonadota bacterium]|nr:MAG: methyltransferase domain-containing protein [Pseudomonadota bacterium]
MSTTPQGFKGCCAGLYELPITTLLLGESHHPGGAQLTRQLAESVLVGPDTRVLDVACGRGTTARLLAEEFGAQVTGVDYSDLIVQNARRATRAAGLEARVDFRTGDAEHLPCEDASIDVVLCECALCTFPDAPRALREFYRVLKPGGRLGISDIVVNREMPAALQTVVGHVVCIAGARSADGYLELIDEAGFNTTRSRNASSALLEMMTRVEQRLRLADVIAQLETLELPDDLTHSAETLDEARSFITAGGAGYALFSARKPR